jgi:hypothetical protein
MGAMPEWEAVLRYEMDAVQALPHTVVYLEGGYSDANTVAYTSQILKAIGVAKVRGFYVNGTHGVWTHTEDAYATAIAKRTGDAHFIVNTAEDGRGPVLNPIRRRRASRTCVTRPAAGSASVNDRHRPALRRRLPVDPSPRQQLRLSRRSTRWHILAPARRDRGRPRQ